MMNRNRRWSSDGADAPLGDSLYWDRWARRLALAAHDGPPVRVAASEAPAAAEYGANAHVRCCRTRITANLERLVEELREEAERLNEQAADMLLFTESA